MGYGHLEWQHWSSQKEGGSVIKLKYESNTSKPLSLYGPVPSKAILQSSHQTHGFYKFFDFSSDQIENLTLQLKIQVNLVALKAKFSLT